MSPAFYPPKFEANSFHCPHSYCGVYANQYWSSLIGHRGGGVLQTNAKISVCSHCKRMSYWIDGKLIYPASGVFEPHHEDFPEDMIGIYNEAGAVLPISPRASAALARLVIQKLMIHLGLPGKNVNSDIQTLIDDRKIPQDVQMALDICRITGNNAVHPGEIDFDESPEIPCSLLSLLNYIVEECISRPLKIKRLYAKMPENALNGVEMRMQKTEKED